MKHRGIVKLAEQRYEIRVRVNDPRTGRRKEVRRRVDGVTLRQALALQAELRREVKEARAAGGRARLRLKDFAASWLRGRLDAGKLKASSADKIAIVWEHHIATAPIADLYVDAIEPLDVDAWVDELRRKRYAPGKGRAATRKSPATRSYSAGTVLGYYRVLHAILTAAAAKLRIANPCDGVETPTGGGRRDNYLSAEEAVVVLEAVERTAPSWYAAVLVDVTTGLRWGELSALRWDDIDETGGAIRVSRGNYKGEHVDSTKTGAVKLVPLVPAVADALRAHRRRLLAEQHPGLASGLVWPSSHGGLHRGYPLRKVLARACAAVQLGRVVTPHGLRHTANDLLRRVAPGEVVRSIVGHTTSAMTWHYSHVDEGEKRAAAALVLTVVRPPKGVTEGVITPIAAGASADAETTNPAVTRG